MLSFASIQVTHSRGDDDPDGHTRLFEPHADSERDP